MRTGFVMLAGAGAVIVGLMPAPAAAQSAEHDEPANTPFPDGVPAKDISATLQDELMFQRAMQSYLWALLALKMHGMNEGSAKMLGEGSTVLPLSQDDAEKLN